jgi:hypothetical protein
MRTYLLCSLLLVGATATTPLAAQVEPAADSHGFHLSAAATYSPARFREINGNSFWVQGGGIQAQARKGDHLGLVADARGFHTSSINSSGVGLDLITATIGPRYTLSFAQHKVSVFGQGLAGSAIAFNGLFPNPPRTETSAYSFAFLAGGGVDMRLSHRIAVRAFEANWMHTQLPNGADDVQNALLLGAGLVYHFR